MRTATQVMEDNMAETMSKEIAKEIDFEIIANLLVDSCGWIRVIKIPNSNNHAVDMADWCHEQCDKRSRYRGKTWLFERADDAALFRLTWGI